MRIARRTIELKLKYLRGKNAVPLIPDLRKVEEGLPDPEGRAFFLDLAARSVTFVKKHGAAGEAVFPLNPQKAGRVLLAGRLWKRLRWCLHALCVPRGPSRPQGRGDCA